MKGYDMLLDEELGKQYINEALTLESSIFSKKRVWGIQNRIIEEHKRNLGNFENEMLKVYGCWDSMKALTELNITRIAFDKNKNAQGYACVEGIAISPMADNVLKTMLHEIAHVLLCHVEDESSPDLHEVEAEMVAYIVLNVIGEVDDLAVSRGYIQQYLEDGEFSEESIAKCIDVANKIIVAGWREDLEIKFENESNPNPADEILENIMEQVLEVPENEDVE